MTHSANKFIFSGEYGELTCFYAHRGLYSNPTMALVRMRSPVQIRSSAPSNLPNAVGFLLFRREAFYAFQPISHLARKTPFCQRLEPRTAPVRAKLRIFPPSDTPRHAGILTEFTPRPAREKCIFLLFLTRTLPLCILLGLEKNMILTLLTNRPTSLIIIIKHRRISLMLY